MRHKEPLAIGFMLHWVYKWVIDAKSCDNGIPVYVCMYVCIYMNYVYVFMYM